MKSLRILVGLFLLILVLQTTGKWIVARMDRGHNIVYPDAKLMPVSPRAAKLHESLFVADMHGDPLLWSRDLLESIAHGQIDLPRLKKGNVGLQVFGAVTSVPGDLNYESNSPDTDDITLIAIAAGWPAKSWGSLVERALYFSKSLHAQEGDSSGELRIIRTRQDLESLLASRNNGEKVVGAMLGLEGSHALEGRLENVDRLFDAGYRMLGLAHFFDNEVSGSSGGVDKYGITEFGWEAIQRAREMGMMIDASHASDLAIEALLLESPVPIVFSHTGVDAVCEQAGRNLDDNTLVRLASNGGVAGIGLWEGAICSQDMEAFFRTLDHAVEVAGIDHIGLGSDFDGFVATPIDSAHWSQVTAGLLQRGYDESDIAKLMGGNVLRVMKEVLPQS